MKNKDLDDLIDTAAVDLRQPPETPRDRMWERIEATRARRTGAEIIHGPWERFRQSRLWWPTAAAALIILGIGLGRLSTDEPTIVAEDSAPAVERSVDETAFNPLVVNVLDRADALLTGFRVGVPAGSDGPAADEAPLAEWASGLLLDTRLLMDSPVGEDPRLRDLLTDLEYALAQIARLQGEVREEDRSWITAGLEHRATLERLRAVVSPGTARSTL